MTPDDAGPRLTALARSAIAATLGLTDDTADAAEQTDAAIRPKALLQPSDAVDTGVAAPPTAACVDASSPTGGPAMSEEQPRTAAMSGSNHAPSPGTPSRINGSCT